MARLLAAEPRALREVPALVLPPSPSSARTPVEPQPVELVDRAQHDPPLMRMLLRIGGIEDARDLHHPVQHLPVVHPDQVVPARDPHGLQRVGQHRADLGIRRHARRAHRVGVALVELPEPPRPRLLVPPDRPHRIAPVGRRQVVPVLRIDPRQRRRQVVAEREPVVLLLPGEDALVRAVHVGKELAQRLDRLDRRGLQRLEAVALVDPRDPVEHLGPLGHLRAEIVAEALGRLRLRARLLSVLRHARTPAELARASTGWGSEGQGGGVPDRCGHRRTYRRREAPWRPTRAVRHGGLTSASIRPQVPRGGRRGAAPLPASRQRGARIPWNSCPTSPASKSRSPISPA